MPAARRPSRLSPLKARPAPARPFAEGVAPPVFETSWATFGLPDPGPAPYRIYRATPEELAYEDAVAAVAGGRAEWRTARPAAWIALAARRENDRLDRAAREAAALACYESGLDCF